MEVATINNEPYIIAGTHGHGLYVIKGDSIKVWNKDHGLVSNHLTDIAIHNDSTLWITTNSGISKVSLSNLWHQPDFENLTAANSLVNNHITNMAFADTLAFLGTNSGLQILSTNFQPYLSPDKQVYPTAVQLDNKSVEVTDIIDVPANNNSIEITFRVLAYHFGEDAKYQYRISNGKENWLNNESGKIQLVNLAPGKYDVEARYQRENGEWSGVSPLLQLHVRAYFYETWWFWLCVALLVGSVAFLYVESQLRKRKQQLKLHKQLDTFQYRALAAQMNPHFIFNTLNSINNFVLTNNKEESSSYLAAFSRLIRSILDNSRENVIPLQEVVTNLHRYLELEKLRLKQRLNYIVDVSSELEPLKLKIPPMLIQPFAENSIWHGIAPKSVPGTLQIRFSLDGTFLKIEIEDDGIGRKKSKELQRNRRKKSSVGMSITNRRFELMSSLYGASIIHTVTDLHDESGEPSGTLITIKLPLDNE